MDEMLALLSDQELEAMKSRSWYRAARAWQEARSYAGVRGMRHITQMLTASAVSEEAFTNACLAEMSRRKERVSA